MGMQNEWYFCLSTRATCVWWRLTQMQLETRTWIREVAGSGPCRNDRERAFHIPLCVSVSFALKDTKWSRQVVSKDFPFCFEEDKIIRVVSDGRCLDRPVSTVQTFWGSSAKKSLKKNMPLSLLCSLTQQATESSTEKLAPPLLPTDTAYRWMLPLPAIPKIARKVKLMVGQRSRSASPW